MACDKVKSFVRYKQQLEWERATQREIESELRRGQLPQSHYSRPVAQLQLLVGKGSQHYRSTLAQILAIVKYAASTK